MSDRYVNLSIGQYGTVSYRDMDLAFIPITTLRPDGGYCTKESPKCSGAELYRLHHYDYHASLQTNHLKTSDIEGMDTLVEIELALIVWNIVNCPR